MFGNPSKTQQRKRRRGAKSREDDPKQNTFQSSSSSSGHRKRTTNQRNNDNVDNNDDDYGSGGVASSKRRREFNRQDKKLSFNSSQKDHHQPTNDPPRKGRRPPSEAALELSSRLKALSRDKKWDEALQLYHNSTNDRIRDTHHACIMVDMAARCGNIAEGEKIFQKMEQEKKMTVTVELKTALLKGYSHSGHMAKADALFQQMCVAGGKANKPNVRTLNTLLRGCLWSAATISEDGNSVVGGVVTAERAWEAFKNLNNSDHSMVDVSSYEYTVTLLCHALRTGDARQRIQEMKERFGTHGSAVDDKNPNDDQSLTEALAVVHLALGRAHTILNESEESIRECNNAVEFAKLSKNALKSETSFSRKRGWKESNEDEDRRSQSNSVYREHRLSEIESEAKTIIDICSECVQDGNLAARGLARRMTTRLVYLSGGGSSENQSTTDNINSTGTSSSSSQRCLTNSLFFSFGLSTIAGKLGVLVGDRTTPLKQKESNRILGAVGLQGGILNENDTLNTHRIFSAGIGDAKNQKKRKKKTRRVEVELGAGFGDWIVRKAIENPTIDYMAVELRADRVAQIFARTAIISSSSPVNNLCVIGGDSGRFLSHHLAPGSIDSVYINHPEPPTQTFGADSDTLHSIMQGGEEPAHMLHSSVLIAAISSLKVSGKSQLIIVTDNKWYARLICVTLHKVKTLHPGRIETVNLTKEDNSFQKIEVPEIEGSLSVIYEGQPNETTGYPAAREGAGESYFDRLWRAGAGTHAERKARFVFLERMVDSKNTK